MLQQWEKVGQGLKEGAEIEVMEESCLLACPVCFLILLNGGITHSGLSTSASIIDQESTTKDLPTAN